MAGELHEKCAVAGFVSTQEENAADYVFSTLYALQHRGVEGSGIAAMQADGNLTEHRAPGVVRDVYDAETLEGLQGPVAVGQNRYSTNGSKTKHLQPVIDSHIGFGLGTNGNLPVVDALQSYLEKNHLRTNTWNDSEMKAHSIAQEIRNGHALPLAVERVQHLFHGSYSSVAIHDGVMVAFRDPMGIRPLELGASEDGYAVASETCGLEAIGTSHVRSIRPGEMVVITPDGVESHQLAEGSEKLDMFELVYFARPDSVLYGERVAVVRHRMGEELAHEYPEFAETENALVVPVPETATHAAEGFANALGLEFTNGAVVKNRYVGRTFMLQNQKLRQQFLRIKHSLIPEAVNGKHVIYVDDSIVRLNTAPVLVELAKAAGASKVSLLSSSPPVLYPDFYGIDTPKQSELAAANMTLEQMQEEIDATFLGFLSLSGLVKPHANHTIDSI